MRLAADVLLNHLRLAGGGRDELRILWEGVRHWPDLHGEHVHLRLRTGEPRDSTHSDLGTMEVP